MDLDLSNLRTEMDLDSLLWALSKLGSPQESFWKCWFHIYAIESIESVSNIFNSHVSLSGVPDDCGIGLPHCELVQFGWGLRDDVKNWMHSTQTLIPDLIPALSRHRRCSGQNSSQVELLAPLRWDGPATNLAGLTSFTSKTPRSLDGNRTGKTWWHLRVSCYMDAIW